MNIVLDIETSGLPINSDINFVGTYDGVDAKIYKFPEQAEVFKQDLAVLLSRGAKFICHNGKFDSKLLMYNYGIDVKQTHDTMVLAYLCSTVPDLQNNRGKWLGLKHCAMRELGVEDWDVGLDKKKSKSRGDVEVYLTKDLEYTWALFEKLSKELDPKLIPTYKLIMRALNVYRDVEVAGMPIDLEMVDDAISEYAYELVGIKEELNKYADINYNSPKQLQELLYKQLKLPIKNVTKTGQPSTNMNTLKELKGQHDIADLVLKLRGIEKSMAFLNDWKARAIDGKLHANFNLHTVVTGRTSCSEPNLQQIPRNKRLKSLFRSIDPDWEFVQLDFSQAELRFAALVSDCRAIKDAYARGEDLHTNMASIVAGVPVNEVTGVQRTGAKAANFGYLYGMQAKSFVVYAKATYGVDIPLEQAAGIRRKFFETNHELPIFYRKVGQDLINNGYITSIMRRQYRTGFKVLYRPDERSNYTRRAINFTVQSSASDYVLCGLVEIGKMIGPEIQIVGTVHDSVIVLVKKNKNMRKNLETIRDTMQAPALAKKMLTIDVDIPIVVDVEIGPWGKGVSIEDYFEEVQA